MLWIRRVFASTRPSPSGLRGVENSLRDSVFGFTGWTPYRILRGQCPDVLRPRATLGLPAFCGAQSLRCGRSRGTRPCSFGTRSPLKPGNPTAVGAGGSRPPVDGQRLGRFNLTWTVNCPSTGSPGGTVPRGRGTVAPAVWPTRPFGCERLLAEWHVLSLWKAPAKAFRAHFLRKCTRDRKEWTQMNFECL